MTINVNMLKGKIVEKGMTMTVLAEKIGVDKTTLYRKLKNNGEMLRAKEINQIIKALGLSTDEAIHIFFTT